ncbi:MAG: DNA polymerase I [Kofleriaceae bacterium]
MERLYIVDGHGYVFRAHFGLMNASRGERREVRLSTSEGMPTGALYVFSRMLMRLAQDTQPDRMVVVFDSGRKSFRTELYPDYKAHRPDPPEELAVQMPYFRQIVQGLRWPVLAIPGVEADDVIATLATSAKARGWEVVIYSADKDLMQLIGPGVSMIDSLHQRIYSAEEVEKKFGVGPAQVADYLAMVGDTSDNIPGLPGIGAKTAAKLLADFGSLAALIEANPVVPRARVKQPFGDPELLDKVQISRQLVELKRDVELPVDLEDLRVGEWDVEELVRLFTELEFGVLLEKLAARKGAEVAAATVAAEPAVPDGEAVAPAAAAPAPRVMVRAVELEALCQEARAAAAPLAVGLELDGQRADLAAPVALIVAVPGQAPAYIPLGHRYIGAPVPATPADLAPVYALLADAAVPKVCHDQKTLRRALAELGVEVAGVQDDVMVAAFLIDPTKPVQAIEAVANQLGGYALPARATLAGRGKTSLEAVDVDRAAPWASAGVYAMLSASGAAVERLTASGLLELYRDVELPVATLLAEVERTGICIDGEHFRQLGARVGAELAALEARVFELAGETFNLGSPKQLGVVLFDKLGLGDDRKKRTKTGYSTDHEVLEGLLETHPIIAPILEHRELAKLKGTYLDALPPLVNPRTGRVHTSFNQVVAATGRISSQDPNLQNIPIRSELGRDIRRGFVAAPGMVLIAADYSQIEMRILAHLSGDELLAKAFRDQVDVHTQTAAEVFSLPLDQVGPAERRVAKAVNYGLIYGQSDFGLARTLDITRTQAHEYSRRYFERFPTIRAFMESVVAEARARGGARTLLGRWRPIADLKSKSPVARRAAERIAQNTPLQGTGADIIKLAMLKTHARVAREGWPARMLLTVHDELVFEAPPEQAERIGAALAEEMTAAYQLSVPLEVDIGVAANWADA